MQTLFLSSTRPFSLNKTSIPSLNEARVLHVTQHSSFVHFNPLRASSNCKEMMLTKRRRGLGPVCYAAPLTPGNLQWISTVSSAGTQEGAILSLAIAGYLAFQHFSWAGSLRKAFDLGSVVATLALICTFAVRCLLLI